MKNSETQRKNLKLDSTHHSDGSELIPAEIHSNVQQEETQPANTQLGNGYTKDDEGLMNNFAVEPEAYPSEYPSPKQQRRYVFLGAGAILLVIVLVTIAFSVS